MPEFHMASPARDFALFRLDSLRLPGWGEAVLRAGRGGIAEPADGRERALAEHIFVGTVKNLLLLQHLVSHYSGRAPKSIDPLVQKILAIGLYQLRFLDRVPASAAVDEAVEQARRFGRTKATGFVNAVPRRATREAAAPLPGRGEAREFARIVLSHPADVFDRMAALLGETDALRLCEHNNAEPPTTVRLFAGRFASDLAAPGVTITPHEQSNLFVVEPAKAPLLAEWAERGIAQAQDPTAALAAEACDIRPGQIVLDRCCGLGTKTFQLLEKLGGTGRLMAMDASAARCDTLRGLADRRSAPIEVIHGSHLARLAMMSGQLFDRILVDAPCSNSGVLARRPEARYAQDARSLRSLERLQAEILDDTAPFVRAGGLMIYSTCSVWPAENQLTVESFIRRQPQFDLIEVRSVLSSLEELPMRYRDGGFVAVLRRKPI